MPEDRSCDKCNDDYWANVALSCAIIGIVLTAGAFLWPVEPDYVIDPDLTAVENEERQLWNYRKTTIILVLMVVGMGLVAVAGLITIAIFYKTIMFDDCSNNSSHNDLFRGESAATVRAPGAPPVRTPSAPPMYTQTGVGEYPQYISESNYGTGGDLATVHLVHATHYNPNSGSARSYGALHGFNEGRR